MTLRPFLAHLVEITGHRDHSHLEIAVLSALHQLTGVSGVRTLEIITVRGELMIQQKTTLEDLAVIASEYASTNAVSQEPLSNFPELLSCIQHRLQSATAVTASGDHLLWLPVWHNDKVSICVEIHNLKAYSPEILDVIHGIFQVYKNYHSLLDYSERDALTGLLNRKTFDEQFTKTTAIPSSAELRPDAPVQQDRRQELEDVNTQWLAVVDIDHFKLVNDRFGHLYGDEVLILIANLLKASFRTEDRIFRFGGEEFVILLRSTTLTSAQRIFDRFRHNVEQYAFPQVGKVTISLGFVNIKSESPVVILGHADQALYYAKENGRNQICFYDELVSTGLLQSEISNDTVEFF
ncbi:GGDEF domain-containing protein [Herbaspirillum sp. RTI4]|uniref:GGDEF domain-containing protein n=1 Tax=Herbaspirillum sp. RTI4 TaxID=3048640 RepID=UPI002AB370F9|nr:GGDEF domain-containing protein [Herbaspirillum sp. RTI4]MDY7578197.1 GGDEF domain-containing protein [Herbaspirillum sp. RTI4]MEA9981535.1 GGDEF domain-containing protein [Herbaspirillum sp. RTI4]